jgi:hypothetical protein
LPRWGEWSNILDNETKGSIMIIIAEATEYRNIEAADADGENETSDIEVDVNVNCCCVNHLCGCSCKC